MVNKSISEAGGEPAALFASWVDILKTYGLTFHYEGIAVYLAALREAGFEDVEVKDHTANSTAAAKREHDYVLSEASQPVREALGEDYFKVRIETSALRAGALEARGVLHVHIDARRPA